MRSWYMAIAVVVHSYCGRGTYPTLKSGKNVDGSKGVGQVKNSLRVFKTL